MFSFWDKVQKKSDERIDGYLKRVRTEVKEDMQVLRVQVNQDMERHAGALAEEFQSRVKGVAETVSSHGERFDSIDQKLDTLTQDIKVLNINIGVIKDDVLSIDNRVSTLESKAK